MLQLTNIRPIPRGQRGVVIFIALIALVTLTLTGLALFRTVDTGILVAGNVALKNSALRSGDAGIQRAAIWLYKADKVTLYTTSAGSGYSATGLNDDQATCAGLTWSACWDALATVYTPQSLGLDAAGNTAQYIVQRLCQGVGADSTILNPCAQSPGQLDYSNPSDLKFLAQGTYYRIFVRVDGPRNTVSLLQGMVAL
jgi:Tfp pilus assembly protein PilX